MVIWNTVTQALHVYFLGLKSIRCQTREKNNGRFLRWCAIDNDGDGGVDIWRSFFPYREGAICKTNRDVLILCTCVCHWSDDTGRLYVTIVTTKIEWKREYKSTPLQIPTKALMESQLLGFFSRLDILMYKVPIWLARRWEALRKSQLLGYFSFGTKVDVRSTNDGDFTMMIKIIRIKSWKI